MFTHYFKTAFRSLWKNNIFSLINITGLAIGLAACMLILEYVGFELSYDRFNKNLSDIYRVVNDHYQNGKLIQHSGITYSGVGRAMRDNFPEVVRSSRLVPFDQEIIISGATKIGELKVLAVDASFLSIFSFPLLAGNAATALQEPHTAVISETLARKIFNIHDHDFGLLLGKTLVMSTDSLPYKITGICRDVPSNSHLQFDLLFSYQTIIQNGWSQANDDFSRTDFHTYIQLRHMVDYKKIDARLTSFNRKYFKEKMALGMDEKFYLQPLSRIHLYSDVEFEIGKTGNATTVWGLLIIAALIIVIAWTNYINLATAKSAERAKEVGIKKVAGASRKQLVLQFLTESFVIHIVALTAAVFIVNLSQSWFNALTQQRLSLPQLFQNTFNGYPITVALTILIAMGIFISSFYPALVLSSFKPVLVLNGKFSASGKGIFLRKLLVIGQFAITVVLIIGSIVVYRQVRFMNSQQLGINIDQLLIVKNPSLTAWDSSYLSKANNFINALKQLPQVKNAAASWRIPGEEWPREAHVLRTAADANAPVAMRNIGV
ncbi:MAG TPA: ABC transporter permease, partial [Puia sp.]|nr:ABC transporter permease [Puia sp.]